MVGRSERSDWSISLDIGGVGHSILSFSANKSRANGIVIKLLFGFTVAQMFIAQGLTAIEIS